MTFKYPDIRAALSMLYTDEMDVYRQIERTDLDTALTNNTTSDTPSVVRVPCRLSFGSGKDAARDSTSTHEMTRVNPVILCAPDTAIRAGDRVVVRRTTKTGVVTFSGKAQTVGDPSVWHNHMEIDFMIEGDA